MDASDDAELTVINSDGSGARAGARGPNFKRRVSEDTPGYTPMPEQRSPSPSGSIIFSNADAPRSPTDGRESPTRDAAPPPPVTLSRSPPGARVLAIARRKGVTLLTLSNYDMWGSAGFLSRAFAPFGAAGVSVDMIATSQYAVSVTLDHIPEGTTGGVFRRLCTSLGRIATTTVRYPCAVVSVVGRSLRNALPSLGPGLRALEGVTVYMVAQAAEDLSLSFVVDEEHADALVARLHAELLEGEKSGAATLGPLFSDLPCGKQALPGDAKH
jgi:aspartokinase